MTHTVRVYGSDEASGNGVALLEEHDFTGLDEARQCARDLQRVGAGLVTFTTGEYCDECDSLIPDSQPDMMNADHQKSCSLFPANVR